MKFWKLLVGFFVVFQSMLLTGCYYPIADAGNDISIFLGSSVTVHAGNRVPSTDQNAVDTYSWIVISAPAGSNVQTVSFSQFFYDVNTFNNSFTTNGSKTFTPDVVGDYQLYLLIKTDGMIGLPDVVNVSVAKPNTIPVANAGADLILNTGMLATIDGSASSDADGDALSFHWNLLNKPSGSSAAIISGNANAAFTPDIAGTYRVQLIVNDGFADSVADTTYISVSDPAIAPTAIINTTTNTVVQQSVSLDGAQSYDVNGNPLQYSWSITSKPTGSSVQLLSAQQSVASFSPDVAGDYQVELVVASGSMSSTPDQVVIQVSNVTVPAGSTVTQIQLQSTSNSNQVNVPVTFGQIFAKGDLSPGMDMVGQLADGSTIPMQIDEKATHIDGSVRHAIISFMMPSIGVGAVENIALQSSSSTNPAGPGVTINEILTTSFDAKVNIVIGGKSFTVSVRNLMANQAPIQQWLTGSFANEWHYMTILKDSNGVAHPHLSARFHVRAYSKQAVRVSVVVENNWTYVANPQNYTYNASITVGGQTVYTKSNVTHYHHARWHKAFWWNQNPAVHVKLDTAYMIASKAIPNFDQSIGVAESSMAKLNTKFNGSSDIMEVGLVLPYMPNTGGRDDIGPIPRWTALYVLGMDERMKNAALGTGELAGSWSIHYRDINTDLPVSLSDFPYMTILGRYSDTYNPNTGQYEAFPACGGTCSTPYTADSSHQPSMNYVPYMVTGDFYQLEELHFWANWNMVQGNPGYRRRDLGGITWDQVRGQAWSLRTMARAAYITPDNHSMKSYFSTKVSYNISLYDSHYTNDSTANKLGYIWPTVDGTVNTTRPWMDDFFTWTIGHLIELDFTEALPLLHWKAKFQVGRMTAPGFCYMYGAVYNYKLGVNKTPYATWQEVIDNTFPGASNHACASQAMVDHYMTASFRISGDQITQPNTMVGYPDSSVGFPSNLQPALAVLFDQNATNADVAWNKFINRAVQPNYAGAPQFNVIPR